MSETPVKVVVDLSLPKGQREQIIPLTAEEIAQREADAAQAAIEQAEREAAEAQKAQDKADAIAALQGLGLTEAQINALVGA
jgi:Holliday junction resolvasome RuvABC DNA-binding subunit